MSNPGRCLCGKVSWRLKNEPSTSYHCHCKMCRKVHGTPFGTYYWVSVSDFEWTSERDSIVSFKSVAPSERTFCGECGSVVPLLLNGSMVIPAGSHDEGPRANSHIFVGHKAPWYEITDNIPQYQDFEPGDTEQIVLADKPLSFKSEDGIRGSCLCGAVNFEVIEALSLVYNCHCSRCRRARAAAHATNARTSSEGVRFLKGCTHVQTYRLTNAHFFAQAFCDQCGSALPRVDQERDIAVIPLGALDDDPDIRIRTNIFVASKASWFTITDGIVNFDEGLPR